MNRTWPRMILGAITLTALSFPLQAQNDLEHRLRQVREQQEKAARSDPGRTRRALLMDVQVSLNQVTAREAFEWLTTVTGVPILVNWRQLEAEGIDPNRTVQLVGRGMTVAQSLVMLTRQIEENEPLVIDVTPWYVQVITRRQANLDTEVRTYPIGDLLHTIPQFTNAPEFDLSALLSEGESDLFGGGNQPEEVLSKKEQAEQIMALIRDMVAPDIWRENGGTAGSISYFNESLIVKAPRYVHSQIGGAAVAAAVGFSPDVAVAHSGGLLDLQASTQNGRQGGPMYVGMNASVSQAQVTQPIRRVPVAVVAAGGRAGAAPAAQARPADLGSRRTSYQMGLSR